MDLNFDTLYSEFASKSRVQNNYDIRFVVFEYSPNPNKEKEDRFTQIVDGYFPYPKLFPFKNAHQFPKFMFESKGVYDPNTHENVFNPVKGKYYTFILIYQFYRYKKKMKVKYKRTDLFYK